MKANSSTQPASTKVPYCIHSIMLHQRPVMSYNETRCACPAILLRHRKGDCYSIRVAGARLSKMLWNIVAGYCY